MARVDLLGPAGATGQPCAGRRAAHLADPPAGLGARHGTNSLTPPVARVALLLDVLEARPEPRQQLRAWWAELLGTVDGSTLLSDYGFGSRNAFMSELVERLQPQIATRHPGNPGRIRTLRRWCSMTRGTPAGLPRSPQRP